MRQALVQEDGGLDVGYYGNELTMLKLWLYYRVCGAALHQLCWLIMLSIHPSISPSHQECNSKIRIWTEYYINICAQVPQIHPDLLCDGGGFKWRFPLYWQL